MVLQQWSMSVVANCSNNTNTTVDFDGNVECCSPGWMSDFSWFHQPHSCTLWVHSYTVLGAVVLFLHGLLIVVLLVSVRPSTRTQLRRLTDFLLCHQIIILTTVAGVWGQSGCREVCALSLMFLFGLEAHVNGKIILIMMGPVMGLKSTYRRVERFINIWTACTICLSLCGGILMTVTCRNPDLRIVYNIAAFFQLAVLSVMGSIYVIGVAIVSTMLRDTIRDVNKAAQKMTGSGEQSNAQHYRIQTLLSLMPKLNVIRGVTVMLLGPFILLLILIPVMVETRASFPYFYCIFFTQFGLVLIWGAGAAYFVRLRKITDTTSTSIIQLSPEPKPKPPSQKSFAKSEDEVAIVPVGKVGGE